MKAIISFALALTAFFSYAQNLRPGIPNMLVMDSNGHFNIIEYVDDDGTYGIYLTVGSSYKHVISKTETSTTTISDREEVSILMGRTYEEVMPFLDNLLAMLEAEPGLTTQFTARLSPFIKLHEPVPATCMVVKPFLKSKRLVFMFPGLIRLAHVYMPKWAINSLRYSFTRFYNKNII